MTEKSTYRVVGIDLAIDGKFVREGETVELTEKEALALAGFVVPAAIQEPQTDSVGMDPGNESAIIETAAESATDKPTHKKGDTK